MWVKETKPFLFDSTPGCEFLTKCGDVFTALFFHSELFRLESKVITANPAIQQRGISWLLVKVGCVLGKKMPPSRQLAQEFCA
jgi:hypothetical protein